MLSNSLQQMFALAVLNNHDRHGLKLYSPDPSSNTTRVNLHLNLLLILFEKNEMKRVLS